MKSFINPFFNNEFALAVKKEYKQHPNDNSIKTKYDSLIGDTYIAKENIEEVINDLWSICQAVLCDVEMSRAN